MIACPEIECEAYRYSEKNNCLYYLDVKNCLDYQKRRDRDLLKRREAKNMTATEVMHRSDALAYAMQNIPTFLNVTAKEKMKMNDFDHALTQAKTGKLTAKIDTLTESAKNTATRTKNTVLRVKVGRLAISAIKASLKKTPGVPAVVKAMLDSEYADIVIGAVVPIIVPMITTNKKALRLCEDVAIAGGVAIADQLSFIDDLVLSVVNQISDTVETVSGKKDL